MQNTIAVQACTYRETLRLMWNSDKLDYIQAMIGSYSIEKTGSTELALILSEGSFHFNASKTNGSAGERRMFKR